LLVLLAFHQGVRLDLQGSRGGLTTLRRYGTNWYSALARKRWGKIDAEDLDRARVVGSTHFSELAKAPRHRS
jgi:hypothetical protein